MNKAAVLHPVVVGAGGSQAALCAAEWAVDEALDRGVPLRLVHVVQTFSGTTDNGRLEYAARALVCTGAVVNARGKPVSIDAAILNGDPVTALITESERTSLLCLGVDGSHRDGFAGIGPTAGALARRSRCPVALVRDGPPNSALHARQVAVSTHSPAAVELAFREAKLRGTPIVVVTTEQSAPPGTGAGVDMHDDVVARCHSEQPAAPVELVRTDLPLFDYLAAHPEGSRTVVLSADEVEQLTDTASQSSVRRHNESCTIITPD